jgi:hypothetical protein
MKTCDLCGEEADALVELADQYKLHDLKEVCALCQKQLGAYVAKCWQVLNEIEIEAKQKWYRRIVENLRR